MFNVIRLHKVEEGWLG